MTEKQTNETKNDSADLFDDALAMQRASEAARHITIEDRSGEATYWNVPETSKPPKNAKRNRIIAGSVIALSAAGLTVGAAEAMSPPEFSEQTTTYTVQPNDGILNAAEAVRGHEKEDTREIAAHIKADPANIDVLKGGLHPGEQLVIPVSIKGEEPDTPNN